MSHQTNRLWQKFEHLAQKAMASAIGGVQSTFVNITGRMAQLERQHAEMEDRLHRVEMELAR